MQDIIFVIIGLVGLFFGGDWLVEGASRVALRFRVSPLVIGLTIVALGTSAPELLVSIQAALQGSAGLAMGNVIGSNIANIGLILGLTGLLLPLIVDEKLVRREIPIMIFATLIASLLLFDGSVSRSDGVLLLVGFATFNGLFYWVAKRNSNDDIEKNKNDDSEIIEDGEKPKSINIWVEAGRIAAGSLFLVVGANLMVEGATNLASALGVSDLIIGVTVVAFGTSLPELATSLTAGLKGQSDIAIGNVIGSNVANLLLVLGATATIAPFTVAETAVSASEVGVMIVFTLLLWPFARNREISRGEAGFFFMAYLGFIAYTVLVSGDVISAI